MQQLNPIEKSLFINNKYKEYLKSSFHFGNDEIQTLFEEQLKKEQLFKGPYLDLNLPFEKGKNINELVEEGIVCKSFLSLDDVNFTRPLYYHQEASLRLIKSGRSAVITTGTGSGKTESFLYPILNEILSQRENGNNEVGIRAIFLYPMNALVNDQIDRVRNILKNTPNITFGFFTGETKEKVSQSQREKLAEENDIVIPPNELLSREEIRNNPPDLLFTNYSMLEYLLLRPNDYSIFSNDKLKNWKYVVLDEAHTYHGALGIELGILLRRLTGLSDKKPSFILTSATLGTRGKSEKDIVNFAQNLTGVSFRKSDIVFSNRILIKKEDVEYKIDWNDYDKLLKNKNDINALKGVAEKYLRYDSNNGKELIYELLRRDSNVYKLYEILKNGSKDVKQVIKDYNEDIETKYFVALVDLINLSEKNGIGLFDLKYHSFIRPLSGAYISYLNDSVKFSLTKTNEIDGYKAFELGNCRYCGSPYIVGKIHKNINDNLDYLIQNNEIDVYENYGDNLSVKLDFFLLENVIDEEEIDSINLEEYSLCPKCGCISSKENLNAKDCECEGVNKITIYKVSNQNQNNTTYNNITQCPCCGHKSRSGIISTLNVGKDQGTTIVSQILLESMDEEEENNNTKTGNLTLKLKSQPTNNLKKEKKVKQFLSFSDSRQQASFYAAFIDNMYRRMLYKRLIWEVIKDNNYKDLTLDETVSYLTQIIKQKDLFDNDMSAHKNAWVSVLIDLLKIDGNYDSEGLGLYYFDLDLSAIMDNISEEDVYEAFGEYNINKKDLYNVMQVIFSVFKMVPAIDYVKSTLTPEEKRDNFGYRRFDNYVMFDPGKSIKGVRSFLPLKSSNKVLNYINKVFNCSNEKGKEILDILFNNLGVESKLLKKHEQKDMYQIKASSYIVKNYKKNPFYMCTKCGKLTPYNVHDICVYDKCNGKLIEVDPDKVLETNYYRNQYKNRKIEKIVVKEHTAQIKRKTAKKYQNDFKNKKINILSCSTTFEMGIDIGALETVFMRNVPPTAANYVQRAGRAGRRKDSSAYILTYCGMNSHDYTYFEKPEKMISGIIDPPYFEINNKKIIVRHLMAACFGFFFRKYPSYFENIYGLVFGDGEEKFKNYILSCPKDLNDYINNRVLNEEKFKSYHNFEWFKEMKEEDVKLSNFIDSIQSIVKEYEQAKKIALEDEKFYDANYFKKQIEKTKNAGVIKMLSDYCVIPKYGFPVDVVKLRVYENGKLNDENDLDRDLKIAISEYAPDSEIFVNGKKYVSKYISIPKSYSLPKHYFITCGNCKKVNISVSDKLINTCKYCGEILDGKTECFIEPIEGFKTGKLKTSNTMKPERSYLGEVSYLGGGYKDDNIININDEIFIESSVDDELMVINKSMFYVCPDCGYGERIKGNISLPEKMIKHYDHRQYKCKNQILKNLRIGHCFRTDVTRFIIPSLKNDEIISYNKALSFMYAFLEGISEVFSIDRLDIDGIIELNLKTGSYDVIIYDNVPGGAGHVKRLLNSDYLKEALKSALVKVSQQCCDENTSCYKCLRNYYNQSYHGKLKRKYAKEVIKDLIESCEETKISLGEIYG